MKKTVTILPPLFPIIYGKSTWAERVPASQPHCLITPGTRPGGLGPGETRWQLLLGGKTDLKQFLEENGDEVMFPMSGLFQATGPGK